MDQGSAAGAGDGETFCMEPELLGTFHAERKSHSKLGYLSRNQFSPAQNYACLASMVGMRSCKSEPQNFVRD